METSDSMPKAPNKSKMSFSVDLRLVIVVLLAVIIAMTAVWKPWVAEPQSTDRTITVTGLSTVTAEPDEFVFYPSYEFKDKDKATALAALTKKSIDIVAKLKELGVPDNKIKTDSSGYNYGWYYNETTKENTYTLQLTVTLDKLDKAQKVQDYLVSTSPSGAVSPQASFSKSKQKELESKARDEATKDARSKADQSAKNIGFKVGKVKKVSDGSGFGDVMPMSTGAAMAEDAGTKSAPPSLGVKPGENDLDYSVTVEYYIR